MTIYTDRYGKEHIPPENAVMKSREGAFVICINRGCLLLQWEHYAPLVADLPGGGIEQGEDIFTAAGREFTEETGLDFPFSQQDITATHTHTVHYYADVDNEYWTYTQTYLLIEKDNDPLFFEGERPNGENGKMRWVNVGDLKNIQFHAMHQRGFNALKDKI